MVGRDEELSWVCSGCAAVPCFPSRTWKRKDTQELFGQLRRQREELVQLALPGHCAPLLLGSCQLEPPGQCPQPAG